MTPPLRPDGLGEDEPLRKRIRRAALAQYGFGEDDSSDPVQRVAAPTPQRGSGLYRESEIGNAEIDRSPQTAWKQTKTQAIIDAALAGLSGLDPKGGGAGGFIGSAVQAASRTRGVYDRLTQEEPSSATVPDQLLRYAFSEDKAPSEFDQFTADPTGYAAFKAAGRAPEAAKTPVRPEFITDDQGNVTAVNPTTFGKTPLGKIGKPAAAGGTGKVQDEKMQFGIAGGIEAIDGMTALLAKDSTANVTPVGSKLAEGLSHVPVIGGAFSGLAESASQKAMTPSQQEFQNLTESLAHNIAGLLPNKGLAIFKSLRDVYRSQSGASPEARAAKVVLLGRLRRRLEQLKNGEKVTEDEIANEINGVAASTGEGPIVPAVPAHVNTTAPVQPTGAAPDPRKFFKPRSTP